MSSSPPFVIDDSDDPQTPVSHMDVEYYDPYGVQELRRVMTDQSIIPHVPFERPELHSNASSSITLAALKVDEGIDLEKTSRHIVKK
jgi:hypothetical protein